MNAEVQKFDFELVSPEEKLMAKPVHMAVLPGESGNIGILKDHVALLSALTPGVIQIFEDKNGESEAIFIGGGFADITGDICTVLAEDAVNVNDLNEDDLRQSLQNLREDLSSAEEGLEKKNILQEITLTKAKLEAVTGEYPPFEAA